MPVIREYRPQVSAPGPIQRTLQTPDQFGAAEGQGLRELGGALMSIGDTMARRVEQEETSDITAKVAEANAQLSVELQETIRTAQPGDKTVFENYNKRVEDTLSKLGENVSTPAARQFYNEASARIKGQLYKTSAQGQAELAGIKAVDDYGKTLNNLSTAVMADPSSLQLQRELHNAAIDNLVNTGQLPAVKGQELKTEGERALVRSTVRGWANLNPDYAKKKLDSGEFDQVMGADMKTQMYGEIDQAIRAKEIEKERITRQQEEAVKKQQKVKQNEFLALMHDGKLTAKDILESELDAFGSGSKEQFLQMLKASNDPEARLKTDSSVMISLYNRIHLPDGDPNKLTDENELNKYFGKGLSLPDINRLRDEMQGKETESGKIESQLKNQVLDIAKGQLTKSNPLTGFKDPIGDEQYQRFLIYFLDEYKKQRQAGISPQELLSPDSPKYLGKAIGQYARTPIQIMRDMAPKPPMQMQNGIPQAPAKVEPRLPNESPADYLKRIKGGQ